MCFFERFFLRVFLWSFLVFFFFFFFGGGGEVFQVLSWVFLCLLAWRLFRFRSLGPWKSLDFFLGGFLSGFLMIFSRVLFRNDETFAPHDH